MLLLVFSVIPGDIGEVTMPPSGCQICADTGDCSRAFRDGPGQFCGNWVDRSNHQLPCCCPLNAVCRISPPSYTCTCTCTYAGVLPPYHSESDLVGSILWLWWILGVLAVLLICVGCSYLALKLSVRNGAADRGAYEPVAVTAPLISPVRESLYSSGGQTRPKVQDNCAQGSGVLEPGPATAPEDVATLREGVAFAAHNRPPDDLDVGGDGFDGGLGDVERAANQADSGMERVCSSADES